MTDVSLAVVIPTRNRATLAIDAVKSLLGQRGCQYHVFVSDNSTLESEVTRLGEFCGSLDGPVTYLKPPAPLRMAAHWDWALRTAMEHSSATHFTVHYDRRITKPGNLSLLGAALAAFPADVITFATDFVTSEQGRSLVSQAPWDGRLYIVPTARVVEMTWQGRIREMGHSFPVLSNCAVPRDVLETVNRRFGSICDSTAPDSAFTYRFCETHDRYVHFDRPIGIAYAYERSTGMGFVRNSGGDFADFMQWWGDRPWLDAAPIPGLNIGQNVLFHEYEIVRRATAHPAFKAIDFKGYLDELGFSVLFVPDPARASELVEVLRKHGWQMPEVVAREMPAALTRNIRPRASRIREGWPWVRTLLADLWAPIGAPLKVHRRILGLKIRSRRMRARLFLARSLSLPPGDLTNFLFDSDQEAINQILRWPRRRSRANHMLQWFGDAVAAHSRQARALVSSR